MSLLRFSLLVFLVVAVPTSAASFDGAAGPVSVLTYHQLKLQLPCLREEIVEELVPRPQRRLVFREVVRPQLCTVETYVPVTTLQRVTRTVIKEVPRVVVAPCEVFVEVKEPRLITRKVYREVRRVQLVHRQEYVEQRILEIRKRQVYQEVPLTVLQQECVVRPQPVTTTDPTTGLLQTIEKPVVETRQVPLVVKQYVLRDEVVTVPISRYQLQTRTVPTVIREYHPVWETVVLTCTSYRKEVQVRPRLVKEYVPCTEEVVLPCTRYVLQKQMKSLPIREYHATWEEKLVPCKNYRSVTRREVHPQTVVVPCPQCKSTLRGACGAISDAPQFPL